MSSSGAVALPLTRYIKVLLVVSKVSFNEVLYIQCCLEDHLHTGKMHLKIVDCGGYLFSGRIFPEFIRFVYFEI